MRLLDLFCGAGGASVGYARAGFQVVGVDLEPQPDYPYGFHQGDALRYLHEHGARFDAVHASPPCTEHTTLTCNRGDRSGTADLLPRTLAALASLPHGFWVVENVMGARMPTDLVLCGGMFGLRVYRHRRFTIGPGVMMLQQPEHPRHRAVAARKDRDSAWRNGGFITVTGNDAKCAKHKPKFREALGIDWIKGAGLNLAIPPAYTEFIGAQILEWLE